MIAMKKKTIPVGTIKPEDIKVRKKPVPPARVHKSPKDYDRKVLRKQNRQEQEEE